MNGEVENHRSKNDLISNELQLLMHFQFITFEWESFIMIKFEFSVDFAFLRVLSFSSFHIVAVNIYIFSKTCLNAILFPYWELKNQFSSANLAQKIKEKTESSCSRKFKIFFSVYSAHTLIPWRDMKKSGGMERLKFEGNLWVFTSASNSKESQSTGSEWENVCCRVWYAYTMCA